MEPNKGVAWVAVPRKVKMRSFTKYDISLNDDVHWDRSSDDEDDSTIHDSCVRPCGWRYLPARNLSGCLNPMELYNDSQFLAILLYEGDETADAAASPAKRRQPRTAAHPPAPPTVCHTVKTVTTLIARVLFRRLVHFLAASEYHAVMLDFHAMGQFPGVTGCMDCTHVHIRSPSRDDAEVYRNRKGVFLNVQVALQGYADPSASFLLGAPLPPPPAAAAATDRASRPSTRGRGSAQAPRGGRGPRHPRIQNPPSDLFGPPVRVSAPAPTELLDRLPLWQTPDFAFLPPPLAPPPSSTPVSLPIQAATLPTSHLADQVVSQLDIVLHNPQPILIGVGDQQVLAVIQDIVSPPDILLQAIRAAEIPPPVSDYSSIDEASQSSSETEEEDSSAVAADRILRWLDANPAPDEPASPDEELGDDDNSRVPVLLQPCQWQEVRPSVPPPVVDWDLTAHTFSFHPPADYSNLRIKCSARSVINNRPPSPDQLPVLRNAVACMKASGLIQVTKREPFLNPIQLAPKSSTESRFVLDASHLTRHLSAPSFRLDPLPKVLLQAPLPPSAYFMKVDLAEAFYHITLHPQAQSLTTFA
ncbi:hypothetical protein HPB47_016205 [Ixodes persulcatus]|uniref:Uncharacterized protein n=1 Tax=Ixodes persulcatus TaxID=34615 RepID=A0AC60QRG4_IXOPE|nr:hypothetical protein HPB47_016205 [Ixodes persulcatus]